MVKNISESFDGKWVVIEHKEKMSMKRFVRQITNIESDDIHVKY